MWVVALLVVLYSAADFVLTSPTSAPQQGALGAICAARVVLAYVFARAFDELVWHPSRRWTTGP